MVDSNPKFDLVLSNPPFNLRFDAGSAPQVDWPFGPPPDHNANFAWIQHAVKVLRPGGRAVVIMANNALSSTHARERAIRSALVDAGAVDALVALPGNLFPSTTIPITIWILRKPSGETPGDIFFIDARRTGTTESRSRRTLTENDLALIQATLRDRHTVTEGPVLSRAVPIDEIRANGYTLNPARYAVQAVHPVETALVLGSVERIRRQIVDQHERTTSLLNVVNDQLRNIESTLNDANADGRPVKLGEVCDVVVGPSTPSSRREDGIPVVKSKNIVKNRLELEDVDRVGPDETTPPTQYYLRPDDVVCSRTGEIGKQAIITSAQQGWLLGTSCLRVRPDSSVNARYLLHYLGHPAVRDWLIGNSTGSAIHTLTAPLLCELPIQIPPRATQDTIADILTTIDEQGSLYSSIENDVRSILDLTRSMLMRPVLGRG